MTDDIQKLWQKLQEHFANTEGQEFSNQLLHKAKPVLLTNGQLQVIVANKLMQGLLLNKKNILEPLLSELAGEPIQLNVDCLENDDNDSADIPVTSVEPHSPAFDSHLDPKFRFDNFIVGNSTRFAHAAALFVTEKPGEQYNPLFIYGKPGLGKTHLIQAIGNALLKKNPYARILYATTEEFTNDLINAIRSNTTNALHEKYRKLDCLIIDDIQQLKDKEKTQEEFFNTFNTLTNAHKQIVIASDRLPQEIETLQDRITSRLARGFMGDIQEPDFETRIAILRSKLDALDMQLSPECLNLIASSITNDIRKMESVCNSLHLYHSINTPVTPELVMDIIRKLGSKTVANAENIMFEEVLNTISVYYNISKEELIGKKRNAKINRPRQVLMYLARILTGMTFTQIGKELGNRDHTTTMNGYDKIRLALEKNDDKLSSEISILTAKLRK